MNLLMNYPSLNVSRLADILSSVTSFAIAADGKQVIVQATRAAMADYRDNAMEDAMACITAHESRMAEEHREEDRIYNWDEEAGELNIIVIDRGFGVPSFAQTQKEAVDRWQKQILNAETARDNLAKAVELFDTTPSPEHYKAYCTALDKFIKATDAEVVHAVGLYNLEPRIYRDMEEAGEDPNSVHWVTLTHENA